MPIRENKMEVVSGFSINVCEMFLSNEISVEKNSIFLDM